MKIKITQNQLKELIKEEANRYKRVLELQKKREEIIQQLNELYETDFAMENEPMAPEMEEGLFDFFKKENPADKAQRMRNYILKHPNLQDVPAYWAQKTGLSEAEILEKLVLFLAKEADIVDGKLTGVKSLSFDSATQEFVNKTKVSAPYGPMSGKAEL